MKLSPLLLLLLLVGCAAAPSKRSVPLSSIPDGVWVGDLNFQTIKSDGSRTDQGPADVMIASCGGYVQVWDGNHDGSYKTIGKYYSGASAPDSHLVYFTDKDTEEPGWSEIQSYVLLEVTSTSARLQWTRAVNNRDLAENDANRFFFNHGIGTLTRTNDKCNDKFVPLSRRTPAP